VQGYAANRSFHRLGGGDPKVREVERRAHGRARKRELDDAIDEQIARREEIDDSVLEELRARGVVVVLEGAEATFPLRVDSLERMSTHRTSPKRPWWRLLSVTDAHGDEPEKAMVWISDEYRAQFLRLFEQYLAKTSKTGNAWNRELVANIGRIRAAVLSDLWQSEGDPPTRGRDWWELWLAPGDEALRLLRAFVDDRPSMRIAQRTLRLVDRTVAWVEARWDDLEILPFTNVPLTEVRRPELADTIEDLSVEEQAELATDLADRVTAAGDGAPAVCHLDSGVRRSHVLLKDSLAPADVHSIVGDSGDTRKHGTAMAGLALLGPLDELLLGTATVALAHRLESVKILPDPTAADHDPSAYGLITAHAVSLPEATSTRPRVFCMPVTSAPELPGRPSLWSASIDALAAGVDISASDDGIELLGAPDPDAARLFIISAGNVSPADFQADYRAACDISAIEDPAHSYNALTVGAHTELVTPPDDPSFEGWNILAEHGDISPHSRTSLAFEHRSWPIKPDLCMEGGNVLHDGADGFHERHAVLSVRTPESSGDLAIGSANATSAATAQAARLAALARARYPDFWPETIRGLLVHAAEWTPVMRTEIDAAVAKAAKLRMLRRYGWGVPSVDSVLNSTRSAVTLVTQDEFVPFTGEDFVSRVFRLHQLPWPAEVLRELAEAEVTMRVTLSYFIEPTASRRGWRRRYSYASHGLRFELKNPLETTEQFISRVNREAQQEEDEAPRPAGGSDRWLIGPNQRNSGSLHQDIWVGTGADLAESGVLAVHPVGGWWKYNARRDRMDLPVRYALLVSLRTRAQGVDLWTPVATEIGLPVEQLVAAT
jgi:hypothetical protein